jgi:hypothetical protein
MRSTPLYYLGNHDVIVQYGLAIMVIACDDQDVCQAAQAVTKK